MPRGNPAGYAQQGKDIAKRVANSKMGKFAQRRPIVSAAMGMGALGGIAAGRRRSGLDKPTRRPTGMYGY